MPFWGRHRSEADYLSLYLLNTQPCQVSKTPLSALGVILFMTGRQFIDLLCCHIGARWYIETAWCLSTKGFFRLDFSLRGFSGCGASSVHLTANPCVVLPVEKSSYICIGHPREHDPPLVNRQGVTDILPAGGRYQRFCNCRDPERVRKNYDCVRTDGCTGRTRHAGGPV